MITTVLPAVLRLTDAQLIALSRAAQSGERLVLPPPNVRGAAMSRFFTGLVTRGLVDEVERVGGPGLGGRLYAIIPLGLSTIGIGACEEGPSDASDAAAENAPASEGPTRHADTASTRNTGKGQTVLDRGPQRRGSGRAARGSEPTASGRSDACDRPPASGPRATSKLAQVIALLERVDGASLAQIMASTGWLAHTTRAALSGLRKRRYVLALAKRSDTEESRYSIAACPRAGNAAASRT